MSSWGKSAVKAAFVVLLTASLAACAGYTKQTAEVVQASQTGNVDQALTALESGNKSSDKDLLYYLEKGELLRQKGSFADSRASWLSADEKVRTWEDAVKTDPGKLMGEIGSVLLNDTTRRYDGRDYEKTFLNVSIAMDHVALGEWDNARTEIKKMHEREAIIAEYRSKELDAAEKSQQEKGVKTRSFKELNGYPIETLEDPQVRALKNAYESAFGNYLAGFVYEALGEPSLAAPGYRKAAEMRPNVPQLDDALKNLDARMASRGAGGKTETLFVIETGNAPTINSVTLPIILPIPTSHGLDFLATPISWPVIRPDAAMFVPTSILVDEAPVPSVLLTDVNVMARRSLSDEMPGILARSAARAISRGIAQAALDAGTQNSSNNTVKLVGALFSLAAKVASVATEVADERIWRTLPGTYSVARVSLPAGTHKVSIATPAGPQTVDVTVGGPYALVAMRMVGANLYVAPSPAAVNLPVVVTPVAAPVLPGTPEKKAPEAKKDHKKAEKKTDKKAEPAKADASPAAPAASAPAVAPKN